MNTMNVRLTAAFSFVLISLLGTICFAESLLINGGFEDVESICCAGAILPSTCGQWQGDPATITTAEAGISPFEGSRMLHFTASSPDTPPGQYNTSEVWQLIDVASLSSVISSGTATVTVSYRVNRVAGDAETDTIFGVVIRSYAGTCSGFPSFFDTPTAQASVSLESDANVGTWELITAELQLPTDTTLLAVRVAARENVVNDPTLEFDGHYGDNVVFEILTCEGQPNGTPCTDGNECTENDACLAGSCVGDPILDGSPCSDDGEGCTVDDACLAGSCAGTPVPDGTPCAADDNICTDDECLAGVCGVPVSDGTGCRTDFNECTDDDCIAGVCTHIPEYDGRACPDDGNACTDDECLAGVCTHPAGPDGIPCPDDGDACTDDDCFAGVCTHPAGPDSVPCSDDGDACTDDFCVAGFCTHPAGPDGLPCTDDGNECTDNEECLAGVCVGIPILDGTACADDDNDCTYNECLAGNCGSPVPDGMPCIDESNECSDFEECIAGVCTPSGECDDLDDCTTDSCIRGYGCLYVNLEVIDVVWPTRTALAWSELAPGIAYDVVKGVVAELPVGAGSSEQCLEYGTSGLSVNDFGVPDPWQVHWYLVRARDAVCSVGSYGFEFNSGTPLPERSTAICP